MAMGMHFSGFFEQAMRKWQLYARRQIAFPQLLTLHWESSLVFAFVARNQIQAASSETGTVIQTARNLSFLGEGWRRCVRKLQNSDQPQKRKTTRKMRLPMAQHDELRQ